MIAIPESGVVFGDFDEACIFRIENSRLHKQMGKGIGHHKCRYKLAAGIKGGTGKAVN